MNCSAPCRSLRLQGAIRFRTRYNCGSGSVCPITAQGSPSLNCCGWIKILPGHTIRTRAASLSLKVFRRPPQELLGHPIILDIQSPTPADIGVSGVTNGRLRLPIPQNRASVAVTALETVTCDHPLGFGRSLEPYSQVVAVTTYSQSSDTGDTDGYGKNRGKSGRNILVALIAIKGCEHNRPYRNSGRANAF